MIDILIKGGILMVPIVICSVLALTIILERSWSLRRSKIISNSALESIHNYLRMGQIHEAVVVCKEIPSSMTNIIMAGINNYKKGREEIREAIEDTGKHEVPYLERYMNILSTIAGIAPLLGLLGTVTGMIKVFNVIAAQGVGHPSALAGGISEALITTAAGLTVAIPTLVAHNYFATRANNFINEMEKNSIVLLDILVQNKENEKNNQGE